MYALPDYSTITVRVPSVYEKHRAAELHNLRQQFPQIHVELSDTLNYVLVDCRKSGPEVNTVFAWAHRHLMPVAA